MNSIPSSSAAPFTGGEHVRRQRMGKQRQREGGEEEKEREMLSLLLRIQLKETRMQRADHKFGFDGFLWHGSLSYVHQVTSQPALHAWYAFPHTPNSHSLQWLQMQTENNKDMEVRGGGLEEESWK